MCFCVPFVCLVVCVLVCSFCVFVCLCGCLVVLVVRLFLLFRRLWFTWFVVCLWLIFIGVLCACVCVVACVFMSACCAVPDSEESLYVRSSFPPNTRTHHTRTQGGGCGDFDLLFVLDSHRKEKNNLIWCVVVVFECFL